MAHTLTHAVRAPVEAKAKAGASRWVIRAGIVARPLWVAIAAAQALTREGFDLTRHPISVLSNGERGWIQIASLVVCRPLLVAAVPGLRAEIAAGPGARMGAQTDHAGRKRDGSPEASSSPTLWTGSPSGPRSDDPII